MQTKKIRILYVCLFALLGALLLSIGISYARYKTAVEGTIIFETKEISENEKIYISSAKGWESSSGTLSLNFTLSGGKSVTADKTAYLRVTATAKFNPNATVKLVVDGVTYQAKAYDASSDSVLYSLMGSGTEFRFLKDGKEVYWQPSANKNMTLYIEGVSDESLISLVARQK